MSCVDLQSQCLLVWHKSVDRPTRHSHWLDFHFGEFERVAIASPVIPDDAVSGVGDSGQVERVEAGFVTVLVPPGTSP